MGDTHCFEVDWVRRTSVRRALQGIAADVRVPRPRPKEYRFVQTMYFATNQCVSPIPHAAYLEFSNSPGVPDSMFYLVLEEG